MATTASFKKSISELEPAEQLQVIISLRAERRMFPERKAKTTTRKKTVKTKKPKKEAITAYLDGMGDSEKQLMLERLLKNKGK